MADIYPHLEEELVGICSEEEEQGRLNKLFIQGLVFDTDGRIPLVYSGFNFNTRVARGLLTPGHVEALRLECERLYAASGDVDVKEYIVGSGGGDNDDGDRSDSLDSSFWLPATAEPCSLLESVARAIFDAHVVGIHFDPAMSGAEWWFVVREPRPTASTTLAAVSVVSQAAGTRAAAAVSEGRSTEDRGCAEDDGMVDHDGGADGIAFHFDKDIALAQLGLAPHVHPQLSTVTYLSSSGAPTVVLPLRDGHVATFLAALERGHGQAVDDGPGGGPGGGGDGGACASMVVSYPFKGKHLCFDGRLLHGVPECMNKSDEGGGGPCDRVEESECSSSHDHSSTRRVTFLVNVWLNHRPFAVQRFPFADQAAARSTRLSPAQDAACRACAASSIAAAAVASPPTAAVQIPQRGPAPSASRSAPPLAGADAADADPTSGLGTRTDADAGRTEAHASASWPRVPDTVPSQKAATLGVPVVVVRPGVALGADSGARAAYFPLRVTVDGQGRAAADALVLAVPFLPTTGAIADAVAQAVAQAIPHGLAHGMAHAHGGDPTFTGAEAGLLKGDEVTARGAPGGVGAVAAAAAATTCVLHFCDAAVPHLATATATTTAAATFATVVPGTAAEAVTRVQSGSRGDVAMGEKRGTAVGESEMHVTKKPFVSPQRQFL